MNRVDMMQTLTGFDEANRQGLVETQRTKIDNRVLVHADKPEGTPRWTYARMKGASVTAVAVLAIVDPVQGVPCLHLGYAVREDQRMKGLAKHLANTAIEEFRTQMASRGMNDFFVEAIVEKDNLASIGVARHVLNVEPTDAMDEFTNVPSFQFLKRVTTKQTA